MIAMHELTQIFKALSDRNRLAIFQAIRKGYKCCKALPGGGMEPVGNSVSEIAADFDLSLSTVSHHLKELRGAGLIVCERRGQWVFCRPNEKALERVDGFIKEAS